MPRRNKALKHDRFEIKNNCTTKRKFSTEQQAKKAAEHQMLLNTDLELSTYRCEICCKWHLTRKSD